MYKMNKELKKELFNIYDVVVFEDEYGITQDCVCSVGSYKEIDDNYDVINCNNHNITIYDNGDYLVCEKDGKNMPDYITHKKIIHLYTLKNDNRFYEVYPTDDYGIAENVKPSEALNKLKENAEMFDEIAQENNHSYKDGTVVEAFIYHSNNLSIEQALIQAQGLENENEELKKFKELYQSEIETTDDKETNEFYDRLKENEIKSRAFDEINGVIDMMILLCDNSEIINKICQIINKTLEVIKYDDKETN